MEAFHRSAIRLLALLLTVLLTEIALGAGQSVTAVSSRPCRVVNVTQGKHFPPDSGGALAAAIVAANADDQLTITGICTGTYTLDQHIALTGVATQQFPIPTIDGGQSGSTLSVATGVTAILTDLTITGGTGVPDPVHLGAPGDGGGIVNNGSLTLVSCVVSGNTASRNGNGGGIYNRGSLVVRGASVVTQNTAENEGGGIYILSGNVSVKESSTVSRNVASDFGGGIINGGALTIDASTVTLNRANFGAGESAISAARQ